MPLSFMKCAKEIAHIYVHTHTLNSLDHDVLLQAGPLPGQALVQITTSANVV